MTIFVATLPNGFFGSAGASWKTLSSKKIASGLINDGYHVKFIKINEVVDIDLKSDDILIYTSSEDPSIRKYVTDHVYLASKFCTVIPSFDVLMAHENKGFQQIFRDKYGFGDLEGTYFFHLDQAPKEFPYVYKSVTGAGSAGVRLVKNENDLRKVGRLFRSTLKRLVLFLARKIKLDRESYEIYRFRYQPKRLSVSQNFIPGLKGDYKVLVFGRKVFVLERQVNKGSFKASGSGRFSFPTLDKVPPGMLSYAVNIFNTLDAPYASLDIACSDGHFALIEYQCTNFGPYTLVNSNGYFVEKSSTWEYVEERSDLEMCFSEALLEYVEKLMKTTRDAEVESNK